MDLDRRAMAGALSLLLCWGTGVDTNRQHWSLKRLEKQHLLQAVPTPGMQWPLTFLSGTLLHVGVAGYHDNLDHEAVAPLPDHVDHLPVTNLHHVLTIHLGERQR